MLSRVTWAPFPTREVVERIEAVAERKAIARVCVQAMDYPTVFEDVLGLTGAIHRARTPVSVSCQPLVEEQIKQLAEAGVGRVGIPLDLCTEELSERLKGASAGGPCIWEKRLEALENAVQVIGRGHHPFHQPADDLPKGSWMPIDYFRLRLLLCVHVY